MIKKFYRKHIKNPIKRYGKKMLIAYLLGTAPVGYVTTAIATQIPFTNPKQVVTALVDHGTPQGVVNLFTGGLFKPVTSGIQNLFGSGQEALGKALNNESFVKAGEETKKKASEYFNQAKNTVSGGNKSTASSEPIVVGSSDDYNLSVDETAKLNYYKVIGEATIDEDKFGAPGTIVYSQLDSLGRTQTAYGYLNYKLVSAEKNQKRESFSNSKSERLAGWPTKNSKVVIPYATKGEYKGEMYNRSHLIADSLGGAALKVNAITGTRTQNVGENNTGGMAYIEEKLRQFFEHPTNETVFYEVKPVYTGNELIPRVVEINVKSSDGSINEHILVYNTAKGYTINYNDGTFTKG